MKMPKAGQLPSPAEELETQTKADEAELTKLREQSEQETVAEPETEELVEESLPSKDTEEPTPEVDEPKEEEPDVEDQESELSELERLSARGKERFRKITGKLKEVTAERDRMRLEKENLLSVIKTLQEAGYSREQAKEIAPQIQQEIDPFQSQQNYERDVAQQARLVVEQTLAQREHYQQQVQRAERFQEDLKTVEKEYSVLNEDSPDYNEKLSAFVGDLYESRSSKDPRVRLVDVAKEVMELRSAGAEEAINKQTHKLAKKAAAQAISPSGGKTETVDLADKIKEVDSEAELMELRKQLPLDA